MYFEVQGSSSGHEAISASESEGHAQQTLAQVEGRTIKGSPINELSTEVTVGGCVVGWREAIADKSPIHDRPGDGRFEPHTHTHVYTHK